MKSTFARLLTAGLLTAAASIAHADTLEWGFDIVDIATDGADISATGTFTTTDTLVGGYYTVTGLDGELNGSAMTLLAPGSYGSNDNLFSPSEPYFDFGGLAFSVGSDEWDVYWDDLINYRGCNSSSGSADPTCSGPVDPDTPIDLTVREVPEPTTLALLGLGLAGVWFMRRRALR